ncbi:hypothetical protein CEXT_585021 [Caerostris extrusa]|uniref:Uncharacterized protein n=1 Tax=Caerostris extrusa TaxID=172846 RepID=A0AAV4PDE3_CAEEX|nr:hypothetical protein CEXT_585021 [Caerostris extrusa]
MNQCSHRGGKEAVMEHPIIPTFRYVPVCSTTCEIRIVFNRFNSTHIVPFYCVINNEKNFSLSAIINQQKRISRYLGYLQYKLHCKCYRPLFNTI